eukprot:GHVO01010534.1.p1 GENE.GHVO01010534.1~~GHVO01010534.1.p1  ORF type:complete len:660 (-),score=92.40 GHVO01010534.1:47-1744(-)
MRTGFDVTISDPALFASSPMDSRIALSLGAHVSVLSAIIQITHLPKAVIQRGFKDPLIAAGILDHPMFAVDFIRGVVGKIEAARQCGVQITPTPYLYGTASGPEFFKALYPGSNPMTEECMKNVSQNPSAMMKLLGLNIAVKLATFQAELLEENGINPMQHENMGYLRSYIVSLRKELNVDASAPMKPTDEIKDNPYASHVYHPDPLEKDFAPLKLSQAPNGEASFVLHGDRIEPDRVSMMNMAAAENIKADGVFKWLEMPQWFQYRMVDPFAVKHNIHGVVKLLRQFQEDITRLGQVENWGERSSFEQVPSETYKFVSFSDIVENKKSTSNGDHFLSKKFRASCHLRSSLMKLSSALADRGLLMYPLRPDSGFEYQPTDKRSLHAGQAGATWANNVLGTKTYDGEIKPLLNAADLHCTLAAKPNTHEPHLDSAALFIDHVEGLVNPHSYETGTKRLMGEFQSNPSLMFARWNFINAQIQLQHLKTLKNIIENPTSSDCSELCVANRCFHPTPNQIFPQGLDKDSVIADIDRAMKYLRTTRYTAAKLIEKTTDVKMTCMWGVGTF